MAELGLELLLAALLDDMLVEELARLELVLCNVEDSVEL